MKKVLLLGDSIRMGYDEYVKDILRGKCEVYYDDADNGRFAAYTLWQVNQLFVKYGRFDVVHWNNGYWDMNIEAPMTEAIHPLDEYVHFLKRIIREIRRNGAEIIFATTTPILSGGSTLDNTGTGVKINYSNDWVVSYNNAAKKLAAEENITVNDLYTLMLQDKNYYKCEDMLHLTDEGYRLCAEQAAKLILEKLEK
ncbi:SGNH/GDSL hydrolase family protein [Cohnella cellulosilytica]|uniref:SGNH/GDSL hydrolase family protein n=1 Tax=Cohnella cellulosilytica TaxID=986710 RepID=A0ABW2FDQ2_9BACL